MTPEQWQRVFALVKTSRGCAENERASFLAANCASDEEILKAAQSLLRAEQQMGSFLDNPIEPKVPLSQSDGENASRTNHVASSPEEILRPTSDERLPLSRGATLGRYVVLNLLGRGGMGIVYAAFDPELDRKVALKLLSAEGAERMPGTDGKARLLREAKAMARLSHVNVVAVHDVGTFGDEVFIAMEYVDGCTLKQWLGTQPRNWRDTVDIFVQAGRGLSAAHAAGIVHRDFKPDNVLVGKDGRPRVLDFGLARGTIPADDAQVIQLAGDGPRAFAISPVALADNPTKSGALIGTPAYMAPEQLARGQVDARTDQFSFCAALYQALYGELPFEGDSLPERLSAIRKGRLRSAKASAKVPRWLRDVVIKGLQSEPASRHPSMEVLLHKLQQNPAKVWHRVTAIVAVVLLVTLTPFVSYRVVVHRNSQLCKGAEQKLLGVWDEGRKHGVEAAFLATGASFAADAFRYTKRTLDKYAQTWIRVQTDACEATRVRGEQSDELLDLRMQCLSQRREELEALVELLTAADVKLVQKSAQAAEALASLDECSNAEALKAPVRPPADPATRARVEQLREAIAQTQALYDAGKFSEGLPMATELVNQAKAVSYHALEAEVLYLLGRFQRDNGDYKSAEESVSAAILAAEAGRHDGILAKAWTTLVGIARLREHHQQAHESAKHAFAAIERLGSNDKLPGALLNNEMGILFYREGQYEQALVHYQQASALEERLLGPEHREIAHIFSNMGNALLRLGRTDEAIDYQRRALAIQEKALGPAHPEVGNSLNNLAASLRDRGKYEEARQLLERAVDIMEKALGGGHPTFGSVLNNLGVLNMKLGEYDQALVQLQRAVGILEKTRGPGDSYIAASFVNIGSLFGYTGNSESALEYCRRALAIYEKALGPEHPDLVAPLRCIGRQYVDLGAPLTAIAPLERALSMAERKPGNPTHLADSHFQLARALWDSRRDLKRAEHLATLARDAYAADGEASKKLLDEVDAWLRARRPQLAGKP